MADNSRVRDLIDRAYSPVAAARFELQREQAAALNRHLMANRASDDASAHDRAENYARFLLATDRRY